MSIQKKNSRLNQLVIHWFIFNLSGHLGPVTFHCDRLNFGTILIRKCRLIALYMKIQKKNNQNFIWKAPVPSQV